MTGAVEPLWQSPLESPVSKAARMVRARNKEKLTMATRTTKLIARKARKASAKAPARKGMPPVKAIKEGLKAKATADTALKLAQAIKAKAAEPIDTNAIAQKPKAKAPKAAPAAEAPKYRGIWADAAEAAVKGKLPPAPDFSAPTHASYRARLNALVALAKAGDIKGLVAIEMIPPRSTSPKALHRYRDLALIALRAKAAR
jgi:hypothetical protein